MDIWNHICFSKEMDAGLWAYVQKHNIPVDQRDDSHIAVVEMYSSDPHWPMISAYLKAEDIPCTSDTIFTKEELQQAQWLRVRSIWRTGYPEPMDGFKYETITYTRDNFCPECGVGLEQIDVFRMKKVPSWGRRHFFSLFWVGDEMFVDESVKKAFQDDGITGVLFVPVKDKKGERVHEGVFQLQILNTLDEGLVFSPHNLKTSVICNKCGRRKSSANDGILVQFNHDVFCNAPDIVKTGDYFGVAGNKNPARGIIISQKTYQTIIKNHLERNLMFYPIQLV